MAGRWDSNGSVIDMPHVKGRRRPSSGGRMIIDDLLNRNRAWAAEQQERDPEFFARHLTGQRPQVLWIGCSDSRVPAEQILGCGPGELFIHRNVANIVAYNDVNLTAVLEYSVEYLRIADIIVCGHYGCGGVAAACASSPLYGHIGDWLMITNWARRWVDERLLQEGRTLPSEDYLRLVVDENVRLQVKHLAHLSVVRKSQANTPGVPRLHGWVYDLATGLVTVLVDGR
jgi:carbonic anhydrase